MQRAITYANIPQLALFTDPRCSRTARRSKLTISYRVFIVKDRRPLKRYRSHSVAFDAFSIKLVNDPTALESIAEMRRVILLRYVNADSLNAHWLYFNACNEISVNTTRLCTILVGADPCTETPDYL